MTSFGLTHILLLFGVLQTLQLCLVLALRGTARPAATGSLQALLGVCALLLVDYLLLMRGVYPDAPALAGFSLPLLFLLGPLLLAYVVCQTGGEPQGRWLWHGAAALVCALVLLPWWSMPADDKRAWLDALLANGYGGSQLEPLVGCLLLCLQLAVYCYHADAALERYDTALREQEAGNAVHVVRWLKLVTRGFCLFQLLLYLSWAEWLYIDPSAWQYLRLTMSALALLLVVAGLWSHLQPELFQHTALPLLADLAPAPRYGRARLEPEQLAACKESLERCTRERQPWLDPELRLHGLAELVGLPPHLLSQVINEGFGCNYFEYINRERVTHAQQLLREDAGGRPNMLAIALASGFNSKATFNRSFRQVSGMSPSDYLARHASGAATRPSVNR